MWNGAGRGPALWSQTYLHPSPCCVTLDKLLNFSKSMFCHPLGYFKG